MLTRQKLSSYTSALYLNSSFHHKCCTIHGGKENINERLMNKEAVSVKFKSGTGKTLNLLCSVFHFMMRMRSMREEEMKIMKKRERESY